MAQTIVALVVALLGVHLLQAALRHRALAEAWMGIFFLASALGAELGLRALNPDLDPVVARHFLFAGVPSLTLATTAAYAFTYTVFRRGVPWALGVVIAGTLLAGWGAWHQLAGPSGAPDMTGLRIEFLLGRVLCFAWGTFEALRAYVMARRRLTHGLADPVVVNRFLLFGVWFGLMGVLPMTLAWTRFVGGAAAQSAASSVGPKFVGAIMIVALTLTFFPPRRYLNWVTASHREFAR